MVQYCTKNSGIFTAQIFVTRVMKMVSFHSFKHLKENYISLFEIENDEN